MSEATHAYIGRDRECGCVVAATTDTADKQTAKDVAEFIRDGLIVERVTIAYVREHLGCEHRNAKRQAKQAAPATMEMHL